MAAEICVPVNVADVSLISSRSHSESGQSVSDSACLENRVSDSRPMRFDIGNWSWTQLGHTKAGYNFIFP